MTKINPSVELTREGDVAVIIMMNAPVNALKHELREGVAQALEQVRWDDGVEAVVLAGNERAFSAGADLAEFGKPPRERNLLQVIAAIERFPKPVVAAIHGVALGGGLELALACHYRVGWAAARMGLPEIKLGMLPGAGGTQRLPRAIGPGPALEAIVSGAPITAEQATAQGLLDALLDGPYPAAAATWARKLPHGQLPILSERTDKLADAKNDPSLLDKVAAPLLEKARDGAAAKACVEAVKAAVELPFDQGLALERKLFVELAGSAEAKAQRYLFFAEREAQKIPGLPRAVVGREVRRVGVVGAGTMGGGIAMSFANAGIPVTVVEAAGDALDRGLARIAGNYDFSVKRGSLSADEAKRRIALIDGKLDIQAIADCDMVIEAVFEEMDVKKQIFRQLDAVVKRGAVLATNTSVLDVNEIAAVTARPGDVLGTHFFSPANVMRLVEIVRGAKTSLDVLATAVEVSRRIAKAPVVVGVCDGFVGNRMLAKRGGQSERLLLEGSLPQEVDQALTDFGFKMGPFAMSDLAGLDIGWRLRKARGIKAVIADALCEGGRLGQKTGRGYYAYAADGRTRTPDPQVEALIVASSAKLGTTRRAISREEILERLLFPMINEGARILDEGIAARPGDIDVIWLYGYNWPASTGGPMYYADQIGLAKIAARLDSLAELTGDATMRPCPLLARLASAGEGFASLAGRASAA